MPFLVIQLANTFSKARDLAAKDRNGTSDPVSLRPEIARDTHSSGKTASAEIFCHFSNTYAHFYSISSSDLAMPAPSRTPFRKP